MVTHPDTNPVRCKELHVRWLRPTRYHYAKTPPWVTLMSVFFLCDKSYHFMINHTGTIFCDKSYHLFTRLFVASRNSASWLVSCVCLFVCLSVPTLQVTIKEWSSPNFTIHTQVGTSLGKNWLDVQGQELKVKVMQQRLRKCWLAPRSLISFFVCLCVVL